MVEHKLCREYCYNVPDIGKLWVSHKQHVNIQSGSIYKTVFKDHTIYLSPYWFSDSRLRRT